MTTKLQYSIISLTRAPHNNFALNPLIVHQSYQEPEVGLHRLSSSMDRILESYKVDSIRKMILMQEQVFKQQVQELHRLYNLQKKSVHAIENGLKRRKEITELAERTTNSGFAIRHQTAIETGRRSQAFSARDDPKEVSGSNSGESSRMPIKFDLEMPDESTPSSIQHSEEQIYEVTDVEVELTLSIGRCTTKKRSKSHLHHDCSTHFTQLQDSGQPNEVQELGSFSTKTDKCEEYDEPSSIISNSSAYQENKRPHWLLQDLSLNRT